MMFPAKKTSTAKPTIFETTGGFFKFWGFGKNFYWVFMFWKKTNRTLHWGKHQLLYRNSAVSFGDTNEPGKKGSQKTQTQTLEMKNILFRVPTDPSSAVHVQDKAFVPYRLAVTCQHCHVGLKPLKPSRHFGLVQNGELRKTQGWSTSARLSRQVN